MSMLFKPLVLFPFPLVLIYGISKNLPHRHIFPIFCFLESLKFVTLAHLFYYRYVTVKNYSKYPLHIILLCCSSYLVAVYFVLSADIAYDEQMDEVYKVKMECINWIVQVMQRNFEID